MCPWQSGRERPRSGRGPCSNSRVSLMQNRMADPLINYMNRFVTQYITYLNIWEALSGTSSPLSTNWFWFEPLVGADLLPSTEFKMNFLVKWSAGGISKFVMRSLFFVIRIFSQFVNSCLFAACFNRTGLWTMGWQWGQGPWKRFLYIQVSDVLCYKPIPIIEILCWLYCTKIGKEKGNSYRKMKRSPDERHT